MNKSKIDIKTGTLFPWHFQFIAIIVLIIALSIVVEKTALSIFLIIASVFVFSGFSGVEIDKEERVYREYISFFLIKDGKKLKYPGIEKIFVSTSKTKQQLYTAHTNHSSIFTNEKFNGYLKFNDGRKIHLLTKRKKENLIKSLKKISAFLEVHVEDNTMGARIGSFINPKTE